MRNRLILGAVFLLLLSSGLYAQHHKIWLRSANKALEQKDYTEAIRIYQQVSSEKSLWTGHALFGLGNILAEQKKYQEALSAYEQALKQDGLSAYQMAHIHHNIGNIAMSEKKYEAAIESYKRALILNPSDDDTRYNLVLAQKQIEKSPEKPQEEPQQQSSPSDQQTQSSPQQPKQDNNNTPQGDGKISQEQATKLLDAYRQADERVRSKVERLERESQEQQSNNQRRW